MSATRRCRAKQDSVRSFQSAESGQASVLLLSILGTFLLASVAFAVDMGNLWFHRQAAQTAADAACEAGAMDMLYLSKGTVLPSMGFVPGVGGLCSAGVGGSICTYARFNGYTPTAGGLVNTAVSKDVIYSFPASNSVTGVTGSTTVTYPLLKVIVEENVKTWFMTFVGKPYQVVAAASTCGMTGANPSPVLIVLSPTGAGTLNLSNSGSVNIAGGPQLAVQVNSSDVNAILFASGSDKIDTHKGGPGINFNGKGSNVGVFGNEPNPGGNFQGGGQGKWIPSSPRAANPFASLNGPNPLKMTTSPTSGGALVVAKGTDGCPDTSGCAEFKPGVYLAGIGPYLYWQTMIFVPGIYYMNGSIEVDSEIRLAHPPGWKQTDGVMFYFVTGTLHITNGSGNLGSRVTPAPSTALTCDGTDPDLSHVFIQGSLAGNVIVGPCTANGTYWDANGDTTDTAGTASSPGTRGIIVYHAPTNIFTPSPGNPSGGGNIDGGSTLTFSGSLYYHSTTYQTLFNISNAGKSGGLALGMVIADQVSVEGSGALQLLLNSTSSGTSNAGIFQ